MLRGLADRQLLHMEDRKIMSELAFNLNGDAFDVPPNAAGWRVRKMKHKGAPEVAYGRNGQPLVLPLEADMDDLRAEVTSPGRYRVDPIDENNKPIEGAPAGYVFVHELAQAAPVATTSGPTMTLAPLASPSDSVVIEAMRMNAEIARAVVDRFPQMLEASAILLRAADGAGLPARPPMATDEEGDEKGDEETESGDDTAPAGFDLNALVAQIVPVLLMSLTGGKSKLPGLKEMLDWRKAAPAKPRSTQKTGTPQAAAETVASEPTATETKAGFDPSAIGLEDMAHFIAIQNALAPDEAAIAREVASGFSAEELHAWFDELKKLSVPQAVQKIRVLIAGNTEAVQ